MSKEKKAKNLKKKVKSSKKIDDKEGNTDNIEGKDQDKKIHFLSIISNYASDKNTK